MVAEEEDHRPSWVVAAAEGEVVEAKSNLLLLAREQVEEAAVRRAWEGREVWKRRLELVVSSAAHEGEQDLTFHSVE